REGDFTAKEGRYRRTGEVMHLLRRLWAEDKPFDYKGEFYQLDAAFTSVKPVHENGIPMFFGGASAAAIETGAQYADVYAFWGEPRSAVAARTSEIDPAVARHGRQLRYSLATRPIIADTEAEAWDKAQWIG